MVEKILPARNPDTAITHPTLRRASHTVAFRITVTHTVWSTIPTSCPPRRLQLIVVEIRRCVDLSRDVVCARVRHHTHRAHASAVLVWYEETPKPYNHLINSLN